MREYAYSVAGNDPRTPVIYEFWDYMMAKYPVLQHDVNFYTDIMTLYFNAVRATVKANVVRMRGNEQTNLLKTLMTDFTEAVAGIRESIRNATSHKEITAITVDELGYGLDVVLMADILYRDRQVNVVFVGSAHARHLAERMEQDELITVNVLRDS